MPSIPLTDHLSNANVFLLDAERLLFRSSILQAWSALADFQNRFDRGKCYGVDIDEEATGEVLRLATACGLNIR